MLNALLGLKAEEMVKGFEHERAKFVALSEEDLEQVKIESTNSIEITDFVELAQIDPKYFLESQNGYALLHPVLVWRQEVQRDPSA
jgi:non-homologous end joining protein Ku